MQEADGEQDGTEEKGNLVVIGGAEDKTEGKVILTEGARLADWGNRKIVIMTVSTQNPEEEGKQYTQIFQDLGIKNVEVLDIRAREDARDPKRTEVLEGSSAGAAAMPETMIINGASDESPSDDIDMAPGLGLLPGVVTDSHFAERGRLGRLLAAVARNPRNLGVGIDGNTAIVVHDGEWFEVLGTGAVYVVDGTRTSYSNISEKRAESIISIFRIMLDVLTTGDRYNLVERHLIPAETSKREEKASN